MARPGRAEPPRRCSGAARLVLGVPLAAGIQGQPRATVEPDPGAARRGVRTRVAETFDVDTGCWRRAALGGAARGGGGCGATVTTAGGSRLLFGGKREVPDACPEFLDQISELRVTGRELHACLPSLGDLDEAPVDDDPDGFDSDDSATWGGLPGGYGREVFL